MAVVDAYDDPNAEADLQTYRAQYGLPVCDTANGCFEKVNQQGRQGSYPPPNAGWATEESLDVDMISAICPNCHILLVEANDNTIANLGAAVNEAVALGAKYISNSYGASEYPSETSDDQYYNHPGVVITASAGDNGYGNNYPSSSQYVTAVGGTTLTRDSSVPRGWNETVWGSSSGGGGTGSGCSVYEPKPAWQRDTGCANRTSADVSADANPATGVAIYDTYQASICASPGWCEVGGTSASSPIVASTYALAAAPQSGTYPSSYPYLQTSGLNDITSGANGTCTPAYLCTAGTRYDGPTGLGTPDGVAAFTPATYGTINGTVTDAATSKPLSGAEVDIGSWSATTGNTGQYTIAVPPGRYDVTAKAFGYVTKTVSGVQVTTGQTTTENVALTPAPTVTLSGTITDGSGHGWPLYAKLSVPGTTAVTNTNPVTGSYTLQVPQNSSFTIEADAQYPGYQQVQQPVTVGTANFIHNFSIPVNSSACSAEGYKFTYRGTTQDFNGTTVPPGWTVSNAPGSKAGWAFDDPSGYLNLTGGTGNFAAAEPHLRLRENTKLVSPVMNLGKDTSPILQFDTAAQNPFGIDTSNADVTVNGGKTWANVWNDKSGASLINDQVAVALPKVAGQSQVQLRFHFASPDTGVTYWEVDNVFLGNRTCSPIPGGLVEGNVTDKNTGHGLDGATIADATNPAETTKTGPVPSPGFYQMFVSPAGAQSLTVATPYYAPITKNAEVAANKVTTENVALQGRLKVSPASLSAAQVLGGKSTENLTVTNTGTAPATVRITEQPGGFTMAGQPPAFHRDIAPAEGKSAKVQLIKGSYSPLAIAVRKPHRSALARSVPPSDAVSTGSAWDAVTDYPAAITDNAAATDSGSGDVYSVGGVSGTSALAAGYVYDPENKVWLPLPPMTYAREKPAAAFINGKLYVVGGWDSNGVPVPQPEIYDPAAGKWSAGAGEPVGYAASGVAVLDGKMYIIGGCAQNSCGASDVQVYDPTTNNWSSEAAYPEPIAWEGCGGIAGKVYCAGGASNTNPGTSHAYAYNPATNTWSTQPSMPIDLWGGGYTAANDKLLMSGGVTSQGQDSDQPGVRLYPRPRLERPAELQ